MNHQDLPSAASISRHARMHLREAGARHGWHTIGAGPARFGWAAYTAAGAGTWLGKDAEAANRALRARR